MGIDCISFPNRSVLLHQTKTPSVQLMTVSYQKVLRTRIASHQTRMTNGRTRKLRVRWICMFSLFSTGLNVLYVHVAETLVSGLRFGNSHKDQLEMNIVYL